MNVFLLALSLIAAAAAAEPPTAQARPEVRPAAEADPCRAAEEIAHEPPCLRPEDCGAFHEWKRIFGPPRTELLEPGTTAVARAASPRPRPEAQQTVPPGTCLAAPAVRPSRATTAVPPSLRRLARESRGAESEVKRVSPDPER